MKKFRTQRGSGVALPIAIGFLLLLSGIVPFLLDAPEQVLRQASWLAIFPLSIFAFFAYVLTASTFKLFVSYTITPEGIMVVKPPFHKRLFSPEELQGIHLLAENETQQVVQAVLHEQNQFAESQDIIGYMSMIKKNSPVFRYYTLPARGRGRASSAHTGTLGDVSTEGKLVLLSLRSGEKFLLSPAEPERFVHELAAAYPKYVKATARHISTPNQVSLTTRTSAFPPD